MSWEQARYLNPDPEFSTESVSGTQMDEPFAQLMGHYIDSVVIDGHRIVGVNEMRQQQDGNMYVTCTTEVGSNHLFVYNPIEDGPVSHLLLDAHRE